MGVTVLIIAYFFFIFKAPVSRSTSVCLYRFRGKRALQLPCLLSIHPVYARFLFFVPSLFLLVEQRWIFDLDNMSSNTVSNLLHQAIKVWHLLQVPQFAQQDWGGFSGSVKVGFE